VKAASPEDFPCAVLDVSPLLFPEVKAEGYLVGWLSRTPSDGGSIPPAQPSYWLDTPSSYLTRKGLRCDFHTSVKGMWLPHLPRLGRAEKEGEETTYVSSFMGVEAWRKNEALDSFDVLKKGNLVTVEGYFKPEEWTDAESGAKRSRIVMVATKFYLAPEKEEEKPAPKQAATKKKKSSK